MPHAAEKLRKRMPEMSGSRRGDGPWLRQARYSPAHSSTDITSSILRARVISRERRAKRTGAMGRRRGNFRRG